MSEFSDADQRWMQQALLLAEQGRGRVEPNPMVGCVIVKDHRLLGAGYHQRYGGPHAEREALADAGANDTSSATAYVTLEPCCHHGKTPPCTDALIAAKIGRVIAATRDPHAVVDGGGLAQLRAAGIDVQVGLLADAAQQLNAPYFKRIATGTPWVIAKWAMSLDGRIATHTGHSQWISGESSRRWVHELRGRMDAIVVGSGTALADNPRLTARPPGPRHALRVVMDSQLRLPLDSHLVNTAEEVPVLVVAAPSADASLARALEQRGCRVWMSQFAERKARLQETLELLAKQFNATNVLVEGGGQLLGSFYDSGHLDQCEVFLCPKLLGGQASISPLGGIGARTVDDGPTVRLVGSQMREPDFHATYQLTWSKQSDRD
jgi:diaminohydroxyphosphoribosylaminopyrimidine deaminase / 5-amino-6-(5-phosphoribosylamino)uracil reductase